MFRCVIWKIVHEAGKLDTIGEGMGSTFISISFNTLSVAEFDRIKFLSGMVGLNSDDDMNFIQNSELTRSDKFW